MHIQKITDYCTIITYNSQSIMFGCPADIVKILRSIGMKPPDMLVIPDDFFQFGIYMACLEFYFYSSVFNSFYDGKKILNLVGKKDALARAKTILEQNIDPIPYDTFKNWGIDEISAQRYTLYSEYLRSKTPKLPKIDDCINFIPFKNNKFNIKEITIQENSRNNYTVITPEGSHNIDLNLKAVPKQFFAVPKITAPIDDIQSGMIVIGAGNGFSPYEENSGVVVFENYIPIFIDGSQGTKVKFAEYGYSVQDVPIIILTHLHDDHSNILDLIIEGRKIHLLTLKVIYKGFIDRVAAILNLPCKTIEKSIKFTELKEGVVKRLYGISFLAHETVHSIPCFGIRINKKILISGDGLWGSKLTTALEKGIIDKNTFEKQNAIPFDKDAEIIFMDAGGRVVHPNPEELAALPEKNKKKLILNHVGRRNIPRGSGLKTALSGQSFILKKGWPKMGKEAINTMLTSHLFKDIPQEWLKAFVAQGDIVKFNKGQQINTNKNNISILISGIVTKDENTALYSQGDVILSPGLELQAISNVCILNISKNLFEEFLAQEGKARVIRKLEKIEKYISDIPALFRLKQKSIFSNINKINIKKIKKGDTLNINNQIAVLINGSLKSKQLPKLRIPYFLLNEKLQCEEDFAEILTIAPNLISEEISEAYLEGMRKGVIF